MKIQMAKQIGRFMSLAVVTLFAVAVMLVSGGKVTWWKAEESPPVTSEVAEDQSVMPVLTQPVKRESIQIIDSYAGMIEPWERFNLSFQVAGQIESLGKNENDQPLDVGDLVTQGQILAQLDQRILTARRNEAAATLENADVEYQRLVNLRQRSPGSVSETNLQQASTQHAVAKAILDVADKNLEDSILRAPVDGVISSRMLNPGEAVNMHQQVFEVVQVDKVLLTLGVPESRIVPIQQRFNAMRQAGVTPEMAIQQLTTEDERLFKVQVQRYGSGSQLQDSTREQLTGVVHRISETADGRSGLFRVQVVLDNPQRLLKPGVVAKADLVIDQWEGYRLPIESVIFRDDGTFVYLAKEQKPSGSDSMKLVGVHSDHTKEFIAQEWKLTYFIEQGRELVIRDLPQDQEQLIVRGQHRLTDGRKIQVMSNPDGHNEADSTSRRPQTEPPIAENIGRNR
ncbi:MAG: efflux RND transporter periplasmic adaptor subunit [Pirellulaceae bacterium]